jgi:hypothetical protein
VSGKLGSFVPAEIVGDLDAMRSVMECVAVQEHARLTGEVQGRVHGSVEDGSLIGLLTCEAEPLSDGP